MTKKTLLGLGLSYLAVFTLGNGFGPLMPIYAEKLGATREVAGYYLAFSFLCVSAGALLGGRVSDLVRDRRVVLAVAGTISVPTTWLTGHAHNVLQLSIVTGAGWLLGGVCIGVVGAIVGRQARADERGRVFGILGVTISLASLLGGFTFGKMADTWGYAEMFTGAALFLAVVPLAAILLVSEKPADGARGTATTRRKVVANRSFLLLLLAVTVAWIVAGAGNMGRSLSMDEKGFSNAAISVTGAVGGIVSLPFPLVLGWISDRVGRKSVMIASFLAGTACLLLLAVSHVLLQFWGVAALLSLHAISVSIGPAYVADIVEKDRVGTGISIFQSCTWVGTIIGYLLSGIAFQHFGIQRSSLLAAGFPLLGVLVMLFIRKRATVVPSSTAFPGASPALKE